MLERADIEWALGAMADRLALLGIEATIYVVGGAAVVLEYQPERGATNDVDTWISAHGQAREAVDRVIGDIASERGWVPDWLNDRVMKNGFFPEGADRSDFHDLVVRGPVRIAVGEPRLLFAMKLRASRGRRDFQDLDALVPACGLRSKEEALRLYEHHYPEDPIKPKALAWLDACFEQPG